MPIDLHNTAARVDNAANNKDVESLRTIICELQTQFDQPFPWLWKRVLEDVPGIMDRLCSANLNPDAINKPDNSSFTPLHHAVSESYWGHETFLVMRLLHRGADANARLRDGDGCYKYTPLILGASKNSFWLKMQFLVAYGSDVNAKSSGIHTALSLISNSAYKNSRPIGSQDQADQANREKTIALLVQSGAVLPAEHLQDWRYEESIKFLRALRYI